MDSKRIFWFGMHKILVQTELPRLRELGYEVFNPPYLSSIKDQSACLDWNANQITTLPKEIFHKLANYNFFYNVITPEMSKILNAYFDTVILTIEPLWLVEILKTFKGKIIYRLYGHVALLSKVLESLKAVHMITSRDNFWVVPHAIESATDDDSWFRERERVVPYCMAQEVFEFQDTWKDVIPKNAEIAVTCPNIANPYYMEHYKFLQKNFYQEHFKYYGVQVLNIKKPNLVGTLSRSEFISRFQKSAGYLYAFSEPNVCFLPPIEMMILGGPVLYLSGSLLDKYFKYNSPGRCTSIKEAHYKVSLLLQNDKIFIDEIISSQQDIKNRYHPDIVWPIFDKTFNALLSDKNKAPNWLVFEGHNRSLCKKRIYIFYHYPACDVIFHDGVYTAYEGISRVVRQIVLILATMPEVEICVTARADQVIRLNGYFRDHENKDRVRIFCINSEALHPSIETPSIENVNAKSKMLGFLKKNIKLIARRLITQRQRIFLQKIVTRLSRYQNIRNDQHVFNYIDVINNDRSCAYVFVPHYYLFPDALNLKQKIILYLPDYMPYFFHETEEFRDVEGAHTEVGQLLVQKACKIFCNSNFTKSYLPYCRLNVAAEKIQVSYLPGLNVIKKENDFSVELNEMISSKAYIFYPTRTRPNKNLSLLLRVFERLVMKGHDINLVLTTTLEPDNKAMKVFHSMKHRNRIIFLDVVSDELLAKLYRNAAMLCFTSLAEGNFPPQILEALQYQTPIVASNLEFITERIPTEFLSSIILCEANNEQAFVAGCEQVLRDRELVVKRQNQLYRAMKPENNDLSFRKGVLELFDFLEA